MHQRAALDEDGAVVKAEALVVIVLGPAAGAHKVDGRQEAAEHLHSQHTRAAHALGYVIHKDPLGSHSEQSTACERTGLCVYVQHCVTYLLAGPERLRLQDGGRRDGAIPLLHVTHTHT